MAIKKELLGGTLSYLYLLVLIFCFSCVLGFVTTVASPLYLYFQVLCQVLASNVEGDKSCDLLPENRLCTLQCRKSQKSPDHLFDPNFLHSKIYTIVKLSLVLSFFI